VNSTGNFSITFVTCSGNAASCGILGVDNISQQQGNIMNTTITSPVTNAGNISTCGVSALEFINYTLDGTDYNLSKTSNLDSLLAFTNSGTGSDFTTTVIGSSANNTANTINFNFINNGAAGVFAISNLYVMNLNNTTLIQPFNVDLTNYPQNIGEFYEGNFSGQFTDASNPTPLHNISCSFRLRKYY
jgi:hypothetical protein